MIQLFNKNMKKIIALVKIILGIIFALLLTACSILTSQSSVAAETEIVPTPVSVPAGLNSQTRVDAQTCLVAEKTTIQTNKSQGDLIAWAPEKNLLALVQPANQYSGWFIGSLLIFDAEKAEEVITSEDQSIFGDLTWSPDGSAVAYAVLDQQEAIYSVKIMTLEDGLSWDIFGDIETARTDSFASLKGIREWAAAPELIVTSYCGTDCVRVYQYNPVSLSLLVQEDVRQNTDTSLTILNDYTSPDGKWLLTVDEKTNLWLTSIEKNQVSLLLIDTEIAEIKWSDDSTYLALRSAEQVKIFELGCIP